MLVYEIAKELIYLATLLLMVLLLLYKSDLYVIDFYFLKICAYD